MRMHLKAMLQRVRGSQAAPLALASVDKMSEAEAEQWFRLLQRMQEDTKTESAREGARQPWRHGGAPW